jgi:hypothetical protein
MYRLAALFAVLGIVAATMAAEISASLSPNSAKVGDRLELDVKVTGASGASVQFPIPGNDQFMLLGIDSSNLGSDGVMKYELAVYDTGRFVLPEMPVVLNAGAGAETLYTSPITVAIQSVAPDTATSVLPLKPYREHPFRWADLFRAVLTSIWFWLGLVVMIGAVVWLIWRKYFRKIPVAPEAPVFLLPADEQALRDLISLRDKHYPSRGMVKEHFTEYSQIMRTYLEGRYGFKALEMTTFELERELEGSPYPAIVVRDLLSTFHEADLVKFAKYASAPDRCDDALETGFETVAATKPQEASGEEEKAA